MNEPPTPDSDSNSASDAAEAEMGEDRFDGGDLCPACLAELTAGCGFCPRCAAPVVPTAAIAPFERIFAEGYIYRQAVAAPRSVIVVAGAWLIFLPLVVSGLVVLFSSRLEGAFPCVLASFLGVIGALGLYQVTRNYLRRPPPMVEPA